MSTQETTPLLQASPPSTSRSRDNSGANNWNYVLCGSDCNCPMHPRLPQPISTSSTLDYHFPVFDPAASTHRSSAFLLPSCHPAREGDDWTPGDALILRGYIEGLEELPEGPEGNLLRWYRDTYDRIVAGYEVNDDEEEEEEEEEEENGMFCSLRGCFSSFWPSWMRLGCSDESSEESRLVSAGSSSHELGDVVPAKGTVFVPPKMGGMRFYSSPGGLATIPESDEE